MGKDFLTITGFLFFLNFAYVLTPMPPSVIAFPKERLVFVKEVNSKLYSVLTFFLSRNMIEMPLLLITPMIQSIIMYWMVGLTNNASNFFSFYLTLFAISFAGSSIGLIIGSFINEIRTVPIVVHMGVLPFIAFSGYLKNTQDLSPYFSWLQYLSPVKYGFISLVRN